MRWLVHSPVVEMKNKVNDLKRTHAPRLLPSITPDLYRIQSIIPDLDLCRTDIGPGPVLTLVWTFASAGYYDGRSDLPISTWINTPIYDRRVKLNILLADIADSLLDHVGGE